jgi:two-component system, LytTR family, sensor kinase
MRLRWRRHEAIFVTATAAILLGFYLGDLVMNTPPSGEASPAAPFLDHHFPFHLFRNLLLPDIGLGLLIWLSYLWISQRIVPRLIIRKGLAIEPAKEAIPLSGISMRQQDMFRRGMIGRILKKCCILLGQLLLIDLVLVAGFCFNAYYKQEYLFNYPGFTFFPRMGYHPEPQIDMHGGAIIVAVWLVIFLVFLFAREGLMAIVGRNGPRRSFRVTIANQATAFLMIYLLAIPIGMNIPSIHAGDPLYVFYFGLLSSVFLVFLHLYWFFPEKGETPFFRLAVIVRLLVITFVCTFPVPLFFGFGVNPPFFFLSWAFQLVLVTPISWFFYQRTKKRILELRGLEKALIRSKTDLQFLRSRINPHFLFNALNTLYGTALVEGSERTAVGIQKLGDMMRFMLHENHEERILVDREVEYLQNYISLQKLRIQSSPSISIDDDIRKRGFPHLIEPMLFVPFVENAFKHGISLNERSWIKIKFDYDEKNIRLEVRNSIHAGEANDPEKKASGVGLDNVVKRLKLLYPGRFEFSAREEKNEFVVHLSVQP